MAGEPVTTDSRQCKNGGCIADCAQCADPLAEIHANALDVALDDNFATEEARELAFAAVANDVFRLLACVERALAIHSGEHVCTIGGQNFSWFAYNVPCPTYIALDVAAHLEDQS